VALSLAVGSRRARISLLCTVYRVGKPTQLSEAFSNFADHFRARRRGEYIAIQAKSDAFCNERNSVIHHFAQLLPGKAKSR
jgi:hypothetical protein